MTIFFRLITLLFMALAAACGGGSGSDSAVAVSIATAQMARAVAPSCGYEHVYVTVEKVLIDQVSGSTEVTLPSPRRIDLVGLRNGVLVALGTAPLAAGHYTQVRLVLAANSTSGSGSMANAVLATGGSLTPLSTPSAQQSGLKLQANFDVAAGQRADLILDPDSCQLVNKAGNSGKYLLNPVVAAQSFIVTMIDKGEFRVNTTTPGDQLDPAIAALRDGGYVVTWTSASDVFVQRFDSTGASTAGEVKLNISAVQPQVNPKDPVITGLKGGGYVVTWASFKPDSPLHGSTVYAQAFDATGAKAGGQTSLTAGGTVTEDGEESVIPLSDGGYLVTWQAYYSALSVFPSIYGQRFDSGGDKVGSETKLIAPARGAWYPYAAALPDGAYVVTWIDGDARIFTQRFSCAGDKTGSETFVSAASSVFVDGLAIAGLNDGGYVVTWVSRDGSSDWDIYAQRFDSTGAPVSGKALVNTTTASRQMQPDIAALGDGGYVVTWTSQDGSGWGIYAQRFDVTGARVDGETLVNTTTLSDQLLPAVTGLANGGHVVTWMSHGQDGGGFGIYAQQFDAQGIRR